MYILYKINLLNTLKLVLSMDIFSKNTQKETWKEEKMLSDRETNTKAVEANASSSNSRQDEFTPDKNPKSKQTKSTRKRKR